MAAPDIEDAVAAQEIEVILFVEIVEVSALRAGIDVIESDDPLDFDERRIEVLFVELIIFAQVGGDEALEIERHNVSRRL